MNVEELENRYSQLKSQLDAGTISLQQFQNEVNKLQFQDAEGRHWMIGAQTGQWYRLDGVNWVPAKPPRLSGVRCPRCNAPLKMGDVFCAGCGYQVPDNTPITEPARSYQQAVVPQASSQSGIPVWAWLGCGALVVVLLTGLVLVLAIGGPQIGPQRTATVIALPPSPTHTATARAMATPTKPPAIFTSTKVISVVAPATLIPTVSVNMATIAPMKGATEIALAAPFSTTPAKRIAQAAPPPTVGNVGGAEPTGDIVASLIAEGDRLVLESKFEEAQIKYQAAVQANPQVALTYAQWSRALSLDLKREDSVAKALLATQIDPASAEAYAQLARARDWQGRYEEALAAAQQAVTLDPTSAEAYAFLAEVYLDLGRTEDAQTQAEKALTLDQGSAEVYRSLAYVWAAKNDLPNAISQAERAVQLEPGLWVRYDDLATMLRLVGDCKQALRFYEWAVKIRPKAISYTGIGLCQIESGQVQQAMAALQQAVTLDPQYASAYAALGTAYTKLDQCAQAVPNFDKALSLDPNLAMAKEGKDQCTGPKVTPTAIVVEPTVTPVPPPPVQPPQIVAPPPGVPVQITLAPPPVAPPPRPASQITGKMAYSVYDPGSKTYSIFLANADGSNRRRHLGDASSPDLSPDGRQLAYRNWDPSARGLYAMDLTNGSKRIMTSQTYLEDTLPKWAPASDLITFASRRESDRRVRVYLASAGGKNDWVIRRGSEAAYGDSPNWLPDGRIIYNACVGNDCGLVVMNNDGANPQRVTTDPSDISPDVSPNGSRIAFMSRRDGNWEIYTAATQGGDVRRLTSDAANDGLPVWSPDGFSIAFGSDRGGRWSIWVMNGDGSNQRELFALEGPLDGHVRQEQDFDSRGWVDEHISWIP